MSSYEVAQTWIQVSGLVVSVVALFFLIRYVRSTAGIEKAANEQSEGLSIPYVTICTGVRVPPHPELRASLKTALQAGFGVPLNAEVLGEFIELVNLGNGPALELAWHIGRRQKPGQSYEHSQGDYEGFVPYVASKEKIPLPMSAGLLASSPFVIVETSCRGLSGRKYAHATWLEGKTVISSTSGHAASVDSKK